MPRNVLILGGGGFMGRWLTVHLSARGDAVSAPARAETDVADASSLQRAVETARPDVVVNLAGISSVTHGDVEALYETNMLGHLRLLRAVAAAAPHARVFLASTANLYGDGVGEAPFRESDTPAPRNHYALSKLGAEQLHPLFPNLVTCAVRPFNCIGRGQQPTFFVAKLARAFRRREPEIKLGNTDVKRDFVDIRDVCAMWAALIDAPSPPPVVNFGNGEAVALADVIALMERVSGHHPDMTKAKQFVRTADLAYQRADNQLIAALGYRRQHGLEETLAWMLAEKEEFDEA